MVTTIKFLCSYAGRIVPRYPEGKLRYLGGETRVLSVDSSIEFSDLMSKLVELCGAPVSTLRCPLPTGDLETLVSITSDEDLANVVEEYLRSSPPSDHSSSLKIRAFLLSPPSKFARKTSPPPSTASTYNAGGPTPRFSDTSAAERAHTPRVASQYGYCTNGNFKLSDKYLSHTGNLNYRYSEQKSYS